MKSNKTVCLHPSGDAAIAVSNTRTRFKQMYDTCATKHRVFGKSKFRILY